MGKLVDSGNIAPFRCWRAVTGPLLALLVFAASVPAFAAEGAKTEGDKIDATIAAIDIPHRTIAIIPDLSGPGGKRTIRVAAALEQQLPRLYVSEPVTVTLDKDNATIAALSVGGSEAHAALVLTVMVLIVLAIAFVGAKYDLGAFIVGMDGRYSNSKTQMALWLLTVIAAYLTAIALRFAAGGWVCFDHIDIPQNLLVLSGLSALTFGGAKAVTTQKANAAPPNADLKSPLPATPNKVAPRRRDSTLVRDLFLNDNGQADIGDFQMILITLIAVGAFVLTFIHWASLVDITPEQSWLLPNVDTTLLSLFGLGQGAYLVKKMASNLGEG